MRKIAAIDVDQTVVSLAEDSFYWMFQKMGRIPHEYPTHLSMLNYDLSVEVRDLGYPH